MALEPAQSPAGAARQHGDGVADCERAAHERARDDGAEAPGGEGAVHGQARRPDPRRARRCLSRGREQRVAQRVEALARSRRDSDQRRTAEPGCRQRLPGLGLGQLGELRLHHVDLGERDDGPAHAEQLADRHVLAGLRHHALVGRHHQEHQVDARRAGHHGSHEALVAGHVDHPEPQVVGQVEGRKAQLDRDASLALLGEPIRVDPGQRTDQRRLAVVDVAGRPEDEARGGGFFSAAQCGRSPCTSAGPSAPRRIRLPAGGSRAAESAGAASPRPCRSACGPTRSSSPPRGGTAS